MKINLAAIALILASVAAAHASVIDLTFEGIVPNGSNSVAIGNYYNGGAGGNFGITFSSNALAGCLVTPTDICTTNGTRAGLGDPNSQAGALFFLTGASTYLDDASGFTTGFSLNYSAPYSAGSLSVYSGLNGTGILLGTMALPVTANAGCPGYTQNFCPFVASGLPFAGTAESISFAGVADQIVFDDVTFGSVTPGPSPSPTPEPSSFALLLTGTVAVATGVRRRLQQRI